MGRYKPLPQRSTAPWFSRTLRKLRAPAILVLQAPSLLATLTVYNEGLNTTNWLVTAPSATGTPNVIDCGPGGATAGNSVCVASYPVGTTVTLTAPATGAAFGGWSYNCTNTGPITAAGPNRCTVALTTNDTVGAIFN